MGGCCCCCASRGVELNSSSPFYHYPRVPEEHEPLSSHHVTTSALSTGLLVGTDLDTSCPDTYRPPPTPMPYETYVARTTPGNQEDDRSEAAVQVANSETGIEPNSGDVVQDKDHKESEGKLQTNLQLDSLKEVEDEPVKSSELKKSNEPLQEEEDVCPTCLEEYDAENPKMITKCEHHFHLSCILEWKERSDTCPVCDMEMVFSPAIDG